MISRGNSVLKGEKKVFKTLFLQTQKASVQLKQKIAIAADFILRNKLEENDTGEFNIEQIYPHIEFGRYKFFHKI